MAAPDPSANELAALEIAAGIVENLRKDGQYLRSYNDEDERAVLQRAGRIARRLVKPRKMTTRSGEGRFLAWWTEPTPMEREIMWHQAVEMVNAIAPPLGSIPRRHPPGAGDAK